MPNHMHFRTFFASLLIMLLSLSSCDSWLPEAHRQDVIQGNEIKREALAKIHVGMTKSEITPILGNPTLKDPFHANRWDYIYRYVPGREQARQSRVTLFFEGDKLIRIDDSGYIDPESFIEEEEQD